MLPNFNTKQHANQQPTTSCSFIIHKLHKTLNYYFTHDILTTIKHTTYLNNSNNIKTTYINHKTG